MEDDKKSGSMSDKDRKMAGRFEGFGLKKDDDEEKKGNKKSSKIPRRSLFANKDSEASVAVEAPAEKDNKSEKKGLFGGLLKDKEVAVESVLLVDDKESDTPDKEEFQEVVYDRIQDLEEELEIPLHQEHVEAVTADVDFLEDVSERIEEGVPPVEAIDDAFEDTILPPESDALEADLDNEENFDPIVNPVETEQDNTDDDHETTVVNPIIPPSQGQQNIPPTPNYQPSSPNVVSDPNIVPMNEIYYRNKSSGDLFLGGAMGYLLGRRHGRKSAESELEPRIDKKDAELKQFKSKLEESERKVREAVVDKTSERSPDVTIETKQKEKVSTEKAEQQIEKLKVESVEAEKELVENQEKAFETTVEKVFVPTPTELEKKSDTIETVEQLKDVRSMTVPELLDVAEHIGFEKTNLRELYERHRIDAVNLRRVIIEYMNGGTRYEKMLRGSLEAVEMQRELRGEIKHDDPTYSSPTHDGDGTEQAENANNLSRSGTMSNTEISSNNYRDSAKHVNELIERHAVLSGGTAVALGILTGVAVMLLFFVFG